MGNLHAKGTIHFEWDSGLSAIVLLRLSIKMRELVFFQFAMNFFDLVCIL